LPWLSVGMKVGIKEALAIEMVCVKQSKATALDLSMSGALQGQ
jgi:hypothetical protein